MNPERMIDIGGQSYPLLFNTHAIMQLEDQLRERKLGTLADLERRMAVGAFSITEIVLLLWAMIEGYRRKHRTRVHPYTVDEVTEILDSQEGGLLGMAAKLIETMKLAMVDSEAAVESAGKNGKAGSGTGARSSRKPPSPA